MQFKTYINIEISLINLSKKFLKLLIGKRIILSNMFGLKTTVKMIVFVEQANNNEKYRSMKNFFDSVWAVQRSKNGYKSVNFNPLMVSFAFSPYIDLRVDLNSFLPKFCQKIFKLKL